MLIDAQSHQNTAPLKSAIYQGKVRHRRFFPKHHAFKYSVFMMYLDLDELETVCSLSPFWSLNRRNIAAFKRTDYYGADNYDLKTAIQHLATEKTGRTITGPVRMLTNLRYFGFIINPITIYYCFNETETLEAMVLEVTNTPWKERIQYVLDCDPAVKTQRKIFNKAMHVSPFHPMEHTYDWASTTPNKKIGVHMKNKELTEGNRVVFDATLSLSRIEITSSSLAKILLKYPFMTMKVGWSIYWQALKIVLKGIPFYSHPKVKKPLA
ncbi:DUF1365 domain-containing protein [Marinomonas agarivorans]|nr:DUF1365 domain-containing protein [Marinomonas agarivorans]